MERLLLSNYSAGRNACSWAASTRI
jgi:hypothetical protein